MQPCLLSSIPDSRGRIAVLAMASLFATLFRGYIQVRNPQILYDFIMPKSIDLDIKAVTVTLL